jgi:hypothetical protein
MNYLLVLFYEIDLHYLYAFRETHCRSFKMNDTNSCPFQPKIILNSVDHIHICSRKALNNCENYFPNVTNLTFYYYFGASYGSFATNLNRIIPLLQITKLVIKDYNVWLTQLIEILLFTINIHILKFPWISVSDTEYTSIQQSESFIFVSNTNSIKTVSLSRMCRLAFVRLLLSENKNNNYGLFSLCISRVLKLCIRDVKKLIKSEKFLHDYLIKYMNRDLYLCW